MNTRPKFFWWLLLTIALVALTLFTGCRAFQPEAVIVNRPPETFLIGAPLEGGGGYYHYHMFWYGSDEDGNVVKFAWALTDTSVQDEDTIDDEEDARFNPALDITHLEIANWTTRTDSIFDFQINQGTSPSADMTFHMVAMDDFGDFDRTPARLHFFSNTLGSPLINFFRIEETPNGDIHVDFEPGESDTVGYGKPYRLGWVGSSPNVLGYDLTALAKVDTVFPFDDGLYGYKWLLGGELGGNCVSTFEDCWSPRLFNEATGDSFSYFAEINGLRFKNDGSSVNNPFGKELPSGPVNVRVNSLDIAGVEVTDYLRNFTFVVNHDPETRILNGEADPYDHPVIDGSNPSDDQVYPYYTLLNDTNIPKTRYEFAMTSEIPVPHIPDRSYVVFKALARDNPDDRTLDDNQNFKIGFTGIVNATMETYTSGSFTFSSGAGDINYDPGWDKSDEGWYADTLGFLVGPNTEFSFLMQSVDEHERRDGTPAGFNFKAGYPPCIQCVELLADRGSNSAVDPNVDCYDSSVVMPECYDGVVEYFVPQIGSIGPEPGMTQLGLAGTGAISINKVTHALRVGLLAEEPENFYIFPSNIYSMTVYLHGKDDPREAYLDALNRARGWRYQIDYDCDPGNAIKDGGGADDLSIHSVTWGRLSGSDDFPEISSTDGLWKLQVDFHVPQAIITFGLTNAILVFNNQAGLDDLDLAAEIIDVAMSQISGGTVKAVVLDQTQCSFFPERPAVYHLFGDIRPPGALVGNQTFRDCDTHNWPINASVDLTRGAMDSSVFNDEGELVPLTQSFKLYFRDTALGLIQCSDSQ